MITEQEMMTLERELDKARATWASSVMFFTIILVVHVLLLLSGMNVRILLIPLGAIGVLLLWSFFVLYQAEKKLHQMRIELDQGQNE
ncbi:MAG: hypothetical protein Q8P45_02245 [Candidatus Harrisonbacteria bacterium]|nr:hypothetical protein [Candidatus Harrisonbacteria bacterium]